MKKQTSLMITKIAKILKRHEVKKASLFGSFARGEEKPSSDVDILISFKGQKSYFDLITLEKSLEQQLQKKFDVLTYSSVHKLLKKSILEDEIKIL